MTAVVLLVFGLTGCGDKISDSSSAQKQTHSNGEVKPEFTGPWAEFISTAYSEAKSDFAKEVLRDGKVTESEVSEMKSRFEGCLTDKGFTDFEYYKNGGYAVRYPAGVTEKKGQELERACSESSGEDAISGVYFQMIRNPDNLDENKIIAECLVRNGVVEKSYSAKDYQKESETDNIKFIPGKGGDAVHHECQLDPLGILD